MSCAGALRAGEIHDRHRTRLGLVDHRKKNHGSTVVGRATERGAFGIIGMGVLSGTGSSIGVTGAGGPPSVGTSASSRRF